MIKSIFPFLCGLFLAMSLSGQTSGTLTVKTSTKSTGGNYSPKNILAIWIEDESGHFVKSLLVYGDKRKTHLNTWQASTAAAGTEYNRVDAITGATQSSHATRTCYWDGTNYAGNAMADGTYKVLMELTDKNSTGANASFTFAKQASAVNVSPADVSSFSSISIAWQPESASNVSNPDASAYLVYPNPTDGLIVLKGDDIMEVNVYDISGILVYNSKRPYADIRDYADGTYFIGIKTSEGEAFQKIVKR